MPGLILNAPDRLTGTGPPPPAGFTVSLIDVVCVSEPETPLMVTVEVPVVAVLLAESVNVLVPVVLEGLNEAVTPAGRPEADKLTLPLKPLIGLTEIVLVPLVPWVMLRLLGEAESVKSGLATAPQLFILKLTMRVCQLKLPFVGMYSVVKKNVQSSTGSTVIAL